MSRTESPPPPELRRRRTDRIVGGAIIALGIVVLVVAIMALNKPHGRNAGNASNSAPRTSHAATTRAATHAPTTHASSQPPTSSAPTSSAPATSTPSQSTDVGAAVLKQVPLLVLNNTATNGLASQAADTFRSGGWTVTNTGNLVNDIISTAAYYDPSNPVNLQAAQELQKEFPAIKRVVPRFDGLPTGPIVVVLTNDYTG